MTLAVANSFGTDALTRSSYITVAPSAVAFSPDRAMVNTTVNGILTGTGFVDGMAVALVGTGFPAINATNVNVTGETTLSCTFNLTGALDGLRDIQVTSPEGLSGILVDGFAVTIPSPVSLSAGWNMISVPVENATITLPPEAGPIYRYNGNIYESVPDLAGVSPGEGLWIAATGPCTLTFTGTALDTYTVPASAGWNMIGSCSSEIEPFLDHLVSDPAGALNTQIYTYDPAEGRYVTPTSCTPGCGYWASVTTVCILHFC